MSIQDPNEPQYTPPGASATYDPVTGAPQTPAGGPMPPYPGAEYPPVGFVPGAGVAHVPNPGLAALLGFIPGVGAMYNGQFAKGIAHIAIFAVFSSLSKHVAEIFGLFVAGWVFYMVFEAYQTARAQRDGTPLPDPFGLNNIGDRFGFKGNPDWSFFRGQHGPAGAPPMPDSPYTGPTSYPPTGAQSGYQVDPAGNVYASSGPAVAGTGYVPPVPPPPGYPPYGPPPTPPFAPGYSGPAYGMPPVPPYGVPPVPPYGVPPMPPFGVPPVRQSTLPMGAIWLIGGGLLALLGSMRPFRFLEGEATGGLFLMGLGIFMFLRRQSFASAFGANSSPAARWTLLRSSRGAGTVFIVGLLTLLQGLHVIYWESSWPILLIFLGVVTLAERVALNNVNTSAAYSAMPYAPTPAAEPPVETSSPTSIVPKYTRPENDLNDGEGR
jgi:hypothetical protein